MSAKSQHSKLVDLTGGRAQARPIRTLVRCGAAALLFGLLVFAWSGNAQAAWRLVGIVYVDPSPDDDIAEIETYYDDETGRTAIWEYHYDGSSFAFIVGDSNPDPTEGSGSSENVEDAINRLKHTGGGPVEIPVQMFKTPLGKHLFKTGKKGMIDPFHNPNPGDDVSNGDVGSNNGPPGGDPLGGNGAGGGHGGGGGAGGFDGNGGSMSEQIKNAGKHGGNSNQGGGSGTPPGPKGEPLPGPPEIVNPPWDGGGFVLVSPMQSTAGAPAGRRARTGALGSAAPALQLGAFGPIGAGPIGAGPSPLAGGR